MDEPVTRLAVRQRVKAPWFDKNKNLDSGMETLVDTDDLSDQVQVVFSAAAEYDPAP
jgi:hypothetical protein